MPNAERRTAQALKRIGSIRIDWLYSLCGYVSGICVVGLLAVILAQIVLRWFGSSLPGAAGYAGYLLGISTFLGLSYTLRHDGHIRVELLMARAGRFSRGLEMWSAAFSMLIALYITWHFWDAAYMSLQFGDMSASLDGTPLWIPQAAMTVGVAIFSLALLERLVRTIGGRYRVQSESHEVPSKSTPSEGK